MTAGVDPASVAPPAAAPAPTGFRNDIQGLRAVAVLLVLAYHAGVPGAAGGFVGVDVFFVISGFLITGLLLKEIDRTGSVSLRTFYARRARRLLPATAVVLAASALLTVLVLPVTRWSSIAWDLVASAAYTANWRLAAQSVDYLAADGATSPVQHFWTLAVEEQFYIVWPLLILALVALHRRTRWHLRPMLAGGIGVLAVVSFVWSVLLTTSAPGRAYFVTTTRVWELAIGAMLAFAVSGAARLPTSARMPLSLGGLAAILFAAITFDASTAFPGAAALVPTLGTAAVIAAGTGATVRGADRVLTAAPMRAIGGLSYSLYLWHWPLLVGARELWADPGQPLEVWIGVLTVCFSVVPAWLTFRLVEAPIHHARMLADSPRRNAALALGCTAAAVVAALVVAAAVPAPADVADQTAAGARVLDGDTPEPPSGTDADPPGGVATPDTEDGTSREGGGVVSDAVTFVPGPVEALKDLGTLGGERCIARLDDIEVEPCVYGPADAALVVAVVGDSKMHQWLPAIEAIADERGWRVVTYLKSGCPLVRVAVGRDGGANRPCLEHNERRYEALLGSDVDLVLTSQGASMAFIEDAVPEVRQQAMVDDLVATWQDLLAQGLEVGVVLDNASPSTTVPDCVASHLDRLGDCAFSRAEGLARSAAPVQLSAMEEVPAVRPISLQDGICVDDLCPPVLGGVMVYRQGSHLTATYVASLTERFAETLDEAFELHAGS